MAVVGSGSVPGSPGNDHTSSHRRLLAQIDTFGDPNSDKDVTTDDEDADLDEAQPDGEADALVGVSIGRAQTRLKLATTPAIEKTRALEASHNYFAVDSSSQLSRGPSQDDERYAADGEKPLRSPELQRSPLRKAKSPQSTPSSSTPDSAGQTTQAVAAGHKSRKRASSGPLTVMSNIRKLLPDLSSPSLTKFTGSSLFTPASTEEKIVRRNTVSNTKKHTRNHEPSLLNPCSPRATHWPKSAGLSLTSQSTVEGAVDVRPTTLRRTTSDQSLYLQRVVTDASTFDDTTRYANVAEQANSRFKAITDSLAESSFRIPKFPGLGIANATHPAARGRESSTVVDPVAHARQHLSPGSSPAGSHYPHSASPADTSHPLLKQALGEATGDFVVMGGYRGSILRSAEPPHHQLWAPVKIGLNIRKVDLEVGLTREDEERMEERIVADGILSHIGPIDIARRLLRKMRKCPNARANQLRVHDYGYDWRLSPHYLSQRLIKFLEGLECNRKTAPPEQRGALVIAHSLGGLITRHAVNQRPDLFAGVIYAGVPMNCVNILGPMRNGDDVLISSKVLTAQVNFTLRTSYALLPEDGRCFLDKQTGDRYDVDFFDVNTWNDYRLSPCINVPLAPLARRKTMIGSLSETISSFTPSLPSRRASWFSGEPSSATPDVAEKTSNVKASAEGAAQRVAERMLPSTATATAESSLEPSMKPKPAHRLSVATACTIPPEKAWEYLDRTLGEVKRFKQELTHDAAHQDADAYPPLAMIFGKSVPTVYGARVASREAIKCSDAFDDLAFATGDGVVLASAAQLPPGYRCVKGGRVESDRGHVGLLGDLEAVGQCISAVLEGRRRGIGLGSRAHAPPDTGAQT